MNAYSYGLVVLISLALAGCGGESKSPSSDNAFSETPDTVSEGPSKPTDNPTDTVSEAPSKSTENPEAMRVIAGNSSNDYLGNARACIDKNDNQKCDPEEKPQKTDSHGRFDANAMLGQWALAQATVGKTKNGGEAIDENFILRGKAKKGASITPFTTLLYAQIQQDFSKTSEEEKERKAKAVLAEALGITPEDITADATQGTVNQDKKEKLQSLAQVLVQAVQQISAQAAHASNKDDAALIQDLAWFQFSPKALKALTEKWSPNVDHKPLITDWIKEQHLNLTAERINRLKHARKNGSSDDSNPYQGSDDDNDSISNDSDNCPKVANKDQLDTDEDGQGDACDNDDDGDGIPDLDENDNSKDNCPLISNQNQRDTDGDGKGNACDTDDDGDGIFDTEDNCPLHKNADQADSNGNNKGDVCDTETLNKGDWEKLDVKGKILPSDATEYACVTQNTLNKRLLAKDQRLTWMLLIPKDATFNDLGFTPKGKQCLSVNQNFGKKLRECQGNDPFWTAYAYRGKNTFSAANGLTLTSSKDELAYFIRFLNDAQYCGVSDWTVPSVNELQGLRTVESADKKTIDDNVFTHYNDVAKSFINKQGDPAYGFAPSAWEKIPYHWTRDRFADQNNSVSNVSLYRFDTDEVKTQIESNTQPRGAFILRAVHHHKERFVRKDAKGTPVDPSTSNSWACVHDTNSINQTHFTNPVDLTKLQPAQTPAFGDYSNVKANEIASFVKDLNDKQLCGFDDWYVPNASSIAALKPVYSNQVFAIDAFDKSDTTKVLDYVYVNGDHRMRLVSGDNAIKDKPTWGIDVRLLLMRNKVTTPNAPTNLTVDDANDTLSWSGLHGQNYEISIDGGATWNDASTPYSVGNIDLAADKIKLRVKAQVGVNATSESASPSSGFAKNVAAKCEVDSDLGSKAQAARINGFCYARFEVNISQAAARSACETWGGTLLADGEKFAAIVPALGAKMTSWAGYWLAASEQILVKGPKVGQSWNKTQKYLCKK